MVGKRKKLDQVEVDARVEWNDHGVGREGVVTRDNGNSTYDIQTTRGEYTSVPSAVLALVRGQEVMGRSKKGVALAGGWRTDVEESEGVTEVRWWEWLGVIFQHNMKWNKMAGKLERKGKVKLGQLSHHLSF